MGEERQGFQETQGKTEETEAQKEEIYRRVKAQTHS